MEFEFVQRKKLVLNINDNNTQNKPGRERLYHSDRKQWIILKLVHIQHVLYDFAYTSKSSCLVLQHVAVC